MINILKEINDNPILDVEFNLLTSFISNPIQKELGRMGIMYTMRIDDEEISTVFLLSRELVEDIKGIYNDLLTSGKLTLEEIFLDRRKIKTLKRLEKVLYRESRLKKILNK